MHVAVKQIVLHNESQIKVVNICSSIEASKIASSMSATLDNKNSWQTGNTINYLFLYKLKAIFNCHKVPKVTTLVTLEARYFRGVVTFGWLKRVLHMGTSKSKIAKKCERNTLEKKVVYIL